MSRIAVIGTTSWGTTLAIRLAQGGARVKLLARTEEEAGELQARRQSPSLGVPFPSRLGVTPHPKEALEGAEMVIMAVPSQSMRENVRAIKGSLSGSPILLSVSKGLEAETALRMTQVLAEELGPGLRPGLCALSGPNLAREVVQVLPAAAVVASQEERLAEEAKGLLCLSNLYIYTSADLVGVELGGALKNVITLAAGICEGLGYGDNAKAALMARGLEEMMALGVAAGAQERTFYGLAGVGDLMVTCMSPLSRNHQVGLEVARGCRLGEITASLREVAEGPPTTRGARLLAEKLGVDAPITRAVYQVLFEERDPREAITGLLGQTRGR
ncbi:MAG TPA: NAD(P)H-dependent glycerol-3-phosphate dehydrogenase [Dehalococcoidia bacterium]|nr:NAD(P)H-dependent glycerol-3-phosphate dehydrogenase [Dehalococcoidia bacterium]